MTTWNVLLLLVCMLFPSFLAVSIRELWVPAALRNGTSQTAILDCDYGLDDRDKDSLEVKWYFRHDPHPIYQWVPPNQPQVSEEFAPYVSLDYVSSEDPWSRHRALYLVKLGTHLSGRYACRVSSIYGDDFAAKDMIVYAPASGTSIELHWLRRDVLNVTCLVKGAYPEPVIRIIVRDVSKDSARPKRLKHSYDLTDRSVMYRSVEWAEGSYAAAASGLSLPLPRPDSPDLPLLPAADRALVCQFSIPGTGHVVEAEETSLPVYNGQGQKMHSEDGEDEEEENGADTQAQLHRDPGYYHYRWVSCFCFCSDEAQRTQHVQEETPTE